MAQGNAGQDSADKAAKMGEEMGRASDRPAPGGPSGGSGAESRENAAKMTEKMGGSSDQGATPGGDGTITWSETSTGSDGLPTGTDAASGPGSDGPL